jgi:hypothetical protein
MNWDIADFTIAGIFLLGFALSYWIITSKLKTRKQRIIATAITLGVLALLWGELAVGIFNSPFSGS